MNLIFCSSTKLGNFLNLSVFWTISKKISFIFSHLRFIEDLDTVVMVIFYWLTYRMGNVFKSSIINIKVLFSDLNWNAFLLVETNDIFQNQCGNYKFVSGQNKLGKRVLERLTFDILSQINLVGIFVIGEKNETWVKTRQLLVLI